MPKKLPYGLPRGQGQPLYMEIKRRLKDVIGLPSGEARNALVAVIASCLKMGDTAPDRLRLDSLRIYRELKTSKMKRRLDRVIRRELQPMCRVLMVHTRPGKDGREQRKMLKTTHDVMAWVLEVAKTRPELFRMTPDRKFPEVEVVKMLAALDILVSDNYKRTKNPLFAQIRLDKETIQQIIGAIAFDGKDVLHERLFNMYREEAREYILRTQAQLKSKPKSKVVDEFKASLDIYRRKPSSPQ
jgi:hypothetical protein